MPPNRTAAHEPPTAAARQRRAPRPAPDPEPAAAAPERPLRAAGDPPLAVRPPAGPDAAAGLAEALARRLGAGPGLAHATHTGLVPERVAALVEA